MQLNNVVKKVTKAADKLGLRPGEEVRAACTTNPKGTMKRSVAGGVGGVVGAAIASKGGDRGGPEGGGAAERFPSGQHFLVVTDQRMLACSVAALSGKPKEIAAEWSIGEVASIATEPGKLAIPLTIAFADGSTVSLEAARGTGADTLPAAIQVSTA